MVCRLRAVAAVLFLVVLAAPVRAQTGGPVTIQSIDPGTNATVSKVGDATNNAIRVNIVAGAGSGGTAIADNAAFTQSTTSETPASGLYTTSYTAATSGRSTVLRMHSGGQAYVNLDSVGTNAILTGNGVTGTGSVRVTIASDNTAFNVNAVQSGVWTVQPGNTANTTPWLVAAKPTDACGSTVQDFEAQLTATTLTSVTATTTCPDYILVTNIGAAQTTVLVQDVSTACNTGVCTIVPTTPLAPNTSMQFNLNGLKFTGGIKLQASNANAIQYFIHGRQ
jgi:hypothetical protein